MRKKNCEKNIFSCVRKKIKLQFCNLDHLGLTILANFSNLVDLGNLVLSIFANFVNLSNLANLPNWVLAIFADLLTGFSLFSLTWRISLTGF